MFKSLDLRGKYVGEWKGCPNRAINWEGRIMSAKVWNPHPIHRPPPRQSNRPRCVHVVKLHSFIVHAPPDGFKDNSLSGRSCGIDGCRQAWLDYLHSLTRLSSDEGRPQNRRTRNSLRRRYYHQISSYHSHWTPGDFDQECPTCRYGYSRSEGQNYSGHAGCLARRQETRCLPENDPHLNQQHGDRCYQGGGIHSFGLRQCSWYPRVSDTKCVPYTLIFLSTALSKRTELSSKSVIFWAKRCVMNWFRSFHPC